MASKLVTVFGLALLALLGQAQDKSSSNCEVSVSVDVVDGESKVDCSYDCDEATSVWYSGVMYKRSEKLQSELDSMVQIVFSDGQITGCDVVPYLSTDDLISKEESIQSCIKAAQPQDASLTLCPQYFSKLGDSCYLITPLEREWDTASKYCDGLGWSLAYIDDQTEQDALASVITSEKLYTGVVRSTKNDSIWLTPTGLNASFTDWQTGQPNNLKGKEDCAVFRGDQGGKWYDGRCDLWKRGLCKAEPQQYLVPACLSDELQFEGSCYFVSDVDLTPAEAEDYCEDQGSELAFITSQAEQDFLAGKLTSSVTIGSSDIAFPFFSGGSVSGDCFQMSASDAFAWTDIDCSVAQRALCKKPNAYLASV